jgi:hypothetical protein
MCCKEHREFVHLCSQLHSYFTCFTAECLGPNYRTFYDDGNDDFVTNILNAGGQNPNPTTDVLSGSGGEETLPTGFTLRIEPNGDEIKPVFGVMGVTLDVTGADSVTIKFYDVDGNLISQKDVSI